MTVHSYLRSDELLSYMQGMGFLEFEKKIINFDKHPVAAIIAVLSLEELQTRELYMKSSKQIYTYFF